MLYWENKAIHDTDRSQLIFDFSVKVVTVAEAALAASAIQKICTSYEAVELSFVSSC